ncbi:YjgP/YjgQ family permease [Chryseobacterium carnipullorum]|uniref:Lipopolysaccharide ABC transporter permease n=1 Tax=Chryseobacterium carnipullorum TaxID=1124835 RepID=A0A1M7DCH4_CHRCU|nr:LptF/LptG family permease [Chryseobacterium carnipullorum]AZA50356.1 YjgP/YjgQ family permease [Chryseobacterium carnipullorum]AZA65230.1 YjgP/YjgQ family permease [Chryseobacterium carnipullorum]SHL77118.1 lipopolysaccharide export system permease protein [Chryseobacterium carnipullorum]STC98871.1 lipopolysaccharide ABC transporter permease [Chryseobacterium carnipullorum]
MLKILDRYIIKTFFGPFFFIFSVLFFIFIVNIIWVQLGQFMGKGLSYWQILKLLFYLGISVISMVLPLTILLASIMSFGEFGERYELAAMKAAGISLTRVMAPLMGVAVVLAVMLFFFSNNIIPDFQKKAKNMLFNIAQTKPALNFTPGQFIDQIPGYMVKFDKIYGENEESIEGVFVHRKASTYENQQSIVAERGKFVPAANKNFLKLELYNGYIFEDNFAGKSENVRQKQPDQAIKFDTLVSHFDIGEIINKAIEKEQITDDYRFQTYGQLNETVAKSKKENLTFFSNVSSDVLSQTNSVITYMDKNKSKAVAKPQIKLDTVKGEKKLEIIYNSYTRLENLKTTAASKKNEFSSNIKYFSKVVIYQQRIISYSVTCIIFFLIGASLGSIIRKGGMGLPVIIAIIIFIIFYVMNLGIENISWGGGMSPYLAAWLPNLILLPFGIWMTYKALTDSQLFDAEKYKALFKPITKRFVKNKEHKRYQ